HGDGLDARRGRGLSRMAGEQARGHHRSAQPRHRRARPDHAAKPGAADGPLHPVAGRALNPDVVAAIGRLEGEGLLDAAQAARFRRVARGDLVSVHADLRVLLYASVLVTMAGVSILVAENLDRLGPVAITTALALGAAGCLLWVARRAAPFSWGEVLSPHLALDYVLLLGVLLTGATLAYVEANFTALGRAWPWHLFLVSVLAGSLAVRFDSRVVFSLALSTFAAWRGIRTSLVEAVLFDRVSSLRVEALLCGAAFLALGFALVRLHRKAHFEPVA